MHKPLTKRSHMSAAEVRNFMERHRMDVQGLADAVGVTNSAVRHWISGTRKVPEVEVRVMRLFDANPQFISFFESLGGRR